MKSVLLFLIIYLFAETKASDYGWYLAKQDPNSNRPSPREYPHLIKIDDTHAILYGGLYEPIAYNRGSTAYYNDIYLLDTSSPDSVKWSLISPQGTLPPARSIDCAVYSPIQNALFVYGGTSYNAQLQNLIFYADTWVYRFNTNTWQQLDSVVAAGTRAGMGCDIIKETDQVIITHGSHGVDLVFYNDTWNWNLTSNTWTLLSTSASRPESRFQFEFNRIPGSNDFLFANGQISLSPTFSQYLTDVWVLHSDGQWQQLSISGLPSKVINVAGYALTSNKFLLMAGGDENLDHLTVSDTCKAPLQCVVRANPTNKNFWLRLKLEQGRGDWEEADFEHTIPPLRKPSILVMNKDSGRQNDQYLYLVGGEGWDGQYGNGAISNYDTWALKLNGNKYFN